MPIAVPDVANLQSMPLLMGGALPTAGKAPAFLKAFVATAVAPNPSASGTHAVLLRPPALPPAALLAPLFIDVTEADAVSSIQTQPISPGRFDEVQPVPEMPGVDHTVERHLGNDLALPSLGPAAFPLPTQQHLRPVADLTEHAPFQPGQMETDLLSGHQHRHSSASPTAHPAHAALLQMEIPRQQEVTADVPPDVQMENVAPVAMPLAMGPIDRSHPIEMAQTSVRAAGSAFASHPEGSRSIHKTDDPGFPDEAVTARLFTPPQSAVEMPESLAAASGTDVSMGTHRHGPSVDMGPRSAARPLRAQEVSISGRNAVNEPTTRQSPAPSDHADAAFGQHEPMAADPLSLRDHSLAPVVSKQVTIPPTMPGAAHGVVPPTPVERPDADTAALLSQPSQFATAPGIDLRPRAQIIVHAPSPSQAPPRQITAIEQLPIEAIRSRPPSQPGPQESALRLRWVAYQPEGAADVSPAVVNDAVASTGLLPATRFLTTQTSESAPSRPPVTPLSATLSTPAQFVMQMHGATWPNPVVQAASAPVVSSQFWMDASLGTKAPNPSGQMITPEPPPLHAEGRSPVGPPTTVPPLEPQPVFSGMVATSSPPVADASDLAKDASRRTQQPTPTPTRRAENLPVVGLGAAPSADMARAVSESLLPSSGTEVVEPESRRHGSAPVSAAQAPPPVVENEREPAPEPSLPLAAPVTETAPQQILPAPAASHLSLNVAPTAAPSPRQAPMAQPHSPAKQAGAALAQLPPDQPGRIELTLTPEALGRLHFDMRPEGTGLAITLSAERPETLDLMRRNLPELLAELKQAGVQAGTLSFGAWSEGRHAPTPDNPYPEPEPASHPEAAPLPATPQRRATLARPQGMDLRL